MRFGKKVLVSETKLWVWKKVVIFGKKLVGFERKFCVLDRSCWFEFGGRRFMLWG